MIKILIALDGSELSEQALLHGAAIGYAFDAELVLVRVISDDDTGTRSALDTVDWQLHRRQATAYLERRTQDLKDAGLKASWTLEEGNVADRLICFSQRNDVDLIVLGAFGRSGMGQFARGGTVQKVVSAAKTSVLIAPPIIEYGDLDALIYDRIIVPIDGSCGSHWSLTMASAIAEIHEAELILVQVIERPVLSATLPHVREKQALIEKMVRINRMEAECRMQEIRARLPSNLSVTTEVIVTGNAAHAIDTFADARDASLIVLSAHGDRQNSEWHFGQVPEFLLAHTKRPVLVFQQDRNLAAGKFRSVYLPDQRLNAN